MDSISFPLFVIDADTREILLGNAATFAGRSAAAVTCYALTHHRTEPCTGTAHVCPLEEVKRKKRPVVTEHLHYDPHGRPRHFAIHAFPILDEQGQVRQMVEYNVDITERKQAEAELRHHQQSLESLVGQLERSNEQLREFTSVAVHDIRSPMARISTAAALLEECLEGKLDESERAIFDILIRGVNRTIDMITALYNCCQVGSTPAAWTPVDLNRIVAELQGLQLNQDLTERGGMLVVPERLHVVLGDEMQILELMQNLVGNGLKYHRHAASPIVTIRSRVAAHNRVRIEVADNGIGIRETDRDRVFTAFQRLDDAHQVDGLGLGLTFCKRVAERHGGRIGVESTYGAGSTFWVELPAAPEPPRT